MSVEIINHKNKQILFVDHRDDKNDMEMIDTLNKGIKIEKSMEGNYLLLANYEGTFVSFRYMELNNEFGKKIQREKRAKLALIGINGMKTLLLTAYKKFTGHSNIETFRNEKDAKEWLVS